MRVVYKKIVSVLMILSLLLSLGPISISAAASESVVSQIIGIGLMQGYPDGSFGEDEGLTRAEMAMIAARMMQIEGFPSSAGMFSDVAEDHWAENVIGALAQLKIINGMGDGRFCPEDSVTFNQAIKIIVSVLGYERKAQEAGGYPYGYIAQAVKLGLLKHVSTKEMITRGDLAQVLYNALDVKPTGEFYADNYDELSYTLYQILTRKKTLVEVKGVLSQVSDMSIDTSAPKIDDNCLVINGVKMRYSYPMEEYLGRELIVYAYEDETSGALTLRNFMVSLNCEVVEAAADDVEWSGTKAILYGENKKKNGEVTVSPSSTKIVYNGRAEAISPGNYGIYYGDYRFIDNNGDRICDVLFINEAESFIVDRVNTSTSTVYFANRAALNGRNAVVLDKEDENKTVILIDSEGNEIAVEDVKEENGITVFESSDRTYIKVIVSTNSVEGKISELSDEGIGIDSNAYKQALKKDGTAYFVPEIGDSAIYALDFYGNIIDAIDGISDDYSYAYVLHAGYKSDGINRKPQLITVSGQQPEKTVKKSGDNEIVSYYFKNDFVKTYEFNDNIKLNGVRTESENISADSLKKNIIAFKLDKEGFIKELYTCDISHANFYEHVFNANILSFGGETVMRGYATDRNTMFICVPESGSTDEQDYYVQLKVTDDSTANKVYGTVFFPDGNIEDPNTEPVDVLVIKADMDSSDIPIIQRDSEICIVGDVSRKQGTIFDDEDSWVSEIELLKGGEVVKEVVKSDGTAASVAANLRKGDLVRYTKDGFGRIVNIEKIISCQGLGDNFSDDVYINSSINTETAIYGMAYHAVPAVYDYFSNQMVDRLKIAYDYAATDISNVYRLFHEDPPVIYKYNHETGMITPGIIEDIRTYNQIGADADRILAIVEENDIKAIVIISRY